MSRKSLKNIPLSLFRQFLVYSGLKMIRTSGGHEVWSAKHLKRPVTIQSHKDPVPEFIVRNNLRTMGKTAEDFYDFCING